MTSVAERLRAAVPTYEGVPIAWPCEVRSELLLEAAAEIDQLTRERDEARAEVERLREVLRSYACPASNSSNNQGNLAHYDGGARARKALEAKPPQA